MASDWNFAVAKFTCKSYFFMNHDITLDDANPTLSCQKKVLQSGKFTHMVIMLFVYRNTVIILKVFRSHSDENPTR